MTANTTSRTGSTATAIPWRKEDHFIPKKESGSATEKPTPGQPATPNTPVSRTTTPAALEALGWQVNFQVNPDTQSESVAGIQTRIPHWQELTQAERLYHQAAYGFDHEGRLQLPADQLTNRASKSSHHQASPALEAVLDGRLQHSTEYPYQYGLPGQPLPGWATRLHQLLPPAAEYWVGFSYDDSALAGSCPTSRSSTATKSAGASPATRKEPATSNSEPSCPSYLPPGPSRTTRPGSRSGPAHRRIRRRRSSPNERHGKDTRQSHTRRRIPDQRRLRHKG